MTGNVDTDNELAKEDAAEIAAAENEAEGDASGEEVGDTVIRDTDIVFDCPHCGHNLAIDYRGAGLQINCVNCGETVLVPIPDGMKIDDLDIEPGEILKQLFATRRNLQKAETHADELAEELSEMTERRDDLQTRLDALSVQFDDLKALCDQQADVQVKVAEMADRMALDLAAALGTGEEDDGSEAQTEETGESPVAE